jgi:hypothetical protein
LETKSAFDFLTSYVLVPAASWIMLKISIGFMFIIYSLVSC